MNLVQRLYWLETHATPLGPLSSEITGRSSVASFLEGQHLWIASPEYGCLRIGKAIGDIKTFPAAQFNTESFNATFVAAWMPQIQQFWGRQVLHASSLLKTGSNKMFAFSGNKQSGKSTLAYGLGQREFWQQLGDDMLVFEASGSDIDFIPYPEAPRLRQESLDYFNLVPEDSLSQIWPAADLQLDLIYSLSPQKCKQTPVKITRLSGSDAYTPLLQQAFSLTLKLPNLKRSLVEDYACLTNQAQVFRIEYQQKIEVLPQLLDTVQTHVLQSI